MSELRFSEGWLFSETGKSHYFADFPRIEGPLQLCNLSRKLAEVVSIAVLQPTASLPNACIRCTRKLARQREMGLR